MDVTIDEVTEDFDPVGKQRKDQLVEFLEALAGGRWKPMFMRRSKASKMAVKIELANFPVITGNFGDLSNFEG